MIINRTEVELEIKGYADSMKALADKVKSGGSITREMLTDYELEILYYNLLINAQEDKNTEAEAKYQTNRIEEGEKLKQSNAYEMDHNEKIKELSEAALNRMLDSIFKAKIETFKINTGKIDRHQSDLKAHRRRADNMSGQLIQDNVDDKRRREGQIT